MEDTDTMVIGMLCPLLLCLAIVLAESNNVVVVAVAGNISEQNRAIFRVGKRITNDELLVRDVLRTPGQLTQTPVISFNYDVSGSISYIEVSSDNVSSTTSQKSIYAKNMEFK